MNTNLKRIIEEYFSSVFTVLSEKYDIPECDLESILQSVFEGEQSVTESPKPVKPKPKPKPKDEDEDADEDVKSSLQTCSYIFERSGKNNNKGDKCGTKTKGDAEYCSKHKKRVADSKEKGDECNSLCMYVFERKGKNNIKGEQCGTKTKGDAKYCSKHKNKEKLDSDDKDKCKKTKPPRPRVPSKKKKVEKTEEVITDTKIEKDKDTELKPKIILKKHKNLGVFYHAETRFVFESPLERIIIGKLLDDDIIDPITDSDKPQIEKYQFVIG